MSYKKKNNTEDNGSSELNQFTDLAKKLFSVHKSEIQDKQNLKSHESPKDKI